MTKTWPFILTLVLATSGCGKKSASDSDRATLEDMNRALAVLSMSGRMPSQISELTNFPSLRGKALPKPPPGKKLVIDTTHRAVVFGDE